VGLEIYSLYAEEEHLTIFLRNQSCHSSPLLTSLRLHSNSENASM